MNNDEFYTYEDRAYIKPTLSSGEQEKFIDNLRDTQKQNTAQIGQQTYNLGTQVPSNLGGLGGGESYFTSRYQTPQTNEMVETLKSAAQAQALNDILSNYQSQLKNRYSQAQRSYNKRQRARALAAGTNPTTKKPTPTTGGVDYKDPVIEPDNPPTLTTVPIEGHKTTVTMLDGEHRVWDETAGGYYINGEWVGSNPSVRSFSTRPSGSGGGGGSLW